MDTQSNCVASAFLIFWNIWSKFPERSWKGNEGPQTHWFSAWETHFYSLLSINFLPCSSMFIHFLAGPTHQPQILFSFAVLSFFFPLPFASWDAAFFAFPGLQQRWQDDRAGNTGVSCVCVSWTLRISSGGNVITTGYNRIQWNTMEVIFMLAYLCICFNVLALSPWPVLGLSVVSAAVSGLSSLVVDSSGTGWHRMTLPSNIIKHSIQKVDQRWFSWIELEHDWIWTDILD